MDCVYVCRPGDNEELRYSIRSVVANMPHDNLWLVGYKPSWYMGNFISVPNTTTKFENIRLAIKAAAEHNEISDNFILMNDDFFVIKPANPEVVLHGGLLTDKISRYRSMLETGRYLYVGFMCHQSIEKILKAYFIKTTFDNPPYTHNLLKLARESGCYDLFNENQKDLTR
jgi:hypothetical protein